VTEDEQWLLDQGFGVEVEQAEPDLSWTHLVNQDSLRRVTPDYGRGSTADESIASARRRYEIEQLGT
jgi:hypothetical protein